MKIQAIPITHNVKPVNISKDEDFSVKELSEAIKNKAILMEKMREKSGNSEIQKQLELQGQWKAHSVIRVNGKIAVINFYDAGFQTHGSGNKAVSKGQEAMKQAEALGLTGKGMRDFISDTVFRELKKSYGSSVKMEKYSLSDAPIAEKLQIEMYGQKYTDLHKSTRNIESSMPKRIKLPLIDTKTYMALYEQSLLQK